MPVGGALEHNPETAVVQYFCIDSESTHGEEEQGENEEEVIDSLKVRRVCGHLTKSSH